MTQDQEGSRMKLLLTSGGVTNAAIRDALIDLLGKPIEDSRALLVPTAQWGQPACSPDTVWRTIAGAWGGNTGLANLGWAGLGVLELTALESIGVERWLPWVEQADALLVDGGEAVYLSRWVERSGLLNVLPSLVDTVWLGVSAGSMALTPRIGRGFTDWQPDGSDGTLGLVDFSIFPHLDHPGWSGNTRAAAEAWAAEVGGECYALDDASAVVVDAAGPRVASGGKWQRFVDAAPVEGSP